MGYIFNNDVFVAYGAMNSCIYDLRGETAKIYKLDKKASIFLQKLIAGNDIHVGLDGEVLIQKLLSNSIITPSGSKLEVCDQKYSKNEKRSAWIELTDKCQLKCIYCYGGFDSKQNNTLSIDKLDYVIEQLLINKFNVFKLIGGEPLLYKNLVHTMVKKLSVIDNPYIEIYTNGLLVTKEFLQFCVDYKIKLAIGIFGANEIECKGVTGIDGIFEKQRKIINVIKESGVEYRLSITRTEANSSASNEEISNVYKFPVNLLRQDQVKNVGRAFSNTLIKTSNPSQIKQKYFSKNFSSSFIYENMKRGHSCFKNKICITATFDVYPCIMERTITYGNMLEKPLSEVLTCGKPFMSASKDTIANCRDCEYRYACFDCRVNRESGGDFFAKPSNCGYDPHTGVWVD